MHHRDAQLPVRHVPHLRRLVDQLVHALEEEVRVLQVRDRSHSHQRGADRGTRNRLLTDRRVDDAVVTEFLGQAEVHAERTAEPSGDADVLADEKDLLVVAHLLGDRFAQRLGNREPAFAVAGGAATVTALPPCRSRSRTRRSARLRRAEAVSCRANSMASSSVASTSRVRLIEDFFAERSTARRSRRRTIGSRSFHSASSSRLR